LKNRSDATDSGTNKTKHVSSLTTKVRFVQEPPSMSYFSTRAEAVNHPSRRSNVLDFVAKRVEISETQPQGDWTDLVRRIEVGQTDGMEELYRFFSNGMRFYLCRHTGSQDLDDRLHDLFILIVQAIRRGELREPERILGFVQTVAQRQVFAHIGHIVDARKKEVALQSELEMNALDPGPEQTAILRQREELVQMVLAELSYRDREVLRRFYIEEQSPSQICQQMAVTETQFRLLKSRAKARFGELGRKKLLGRHFPPRLQRFVSPLLPNSQARTRTIARPSPLNRAS
jgi:RNA polymerase sigma factor (sigma-70 family)